MKGKQAVRNTQVTIPVFLLGTPVMQSVVIVCWFFQYLLVECSKISFFPLDFSRTFQGKKVIGFCVLACKYKSSYIKIFIVSSICIH
jgi:hypothetical protein